MSQETRLQLVGDRLLIKPESKNQSDGGIILPDNFGDGLTEGVVVTTGEGRVMDDGSVREPPAKDGMRVLFYSKMCEKITLQGKQLMLCPSGAIIAVLR